MTMRPNTHHRPTKADLIHRLPRGLRPGLTLDQREDLGMCHNVHLDALHAGTADEETLWQWVGSMLTWSKLAQLIRRGEPEMAAILELATRVIDRYGRTGRIHLEGHEYEIARDGVIVMDMLAIHADRANAIQAAEWSEEQVNRMSAACTQRMQTPSTASEEAAA
jgi:hypothetical protein